jgi:hypothetical protein
MTQTLTPTNLFHTPENLDELMCWIERHSPEDRAHLYTAAMMTWNLAAKLTAPATGEEVAAHAEAALVSAQIDSEVSA